MAKKAIKKAVAKAKKPAPNKPAKPLAKAKPAIKAVKAPKEVQPGSGGGNKQRFTLYGHALSMPTYTVALMLSLCKHPFSYFHMNLREGAHKQPDYLVKNRYGQVPALRDGHHHVVQSAAILEYLADSLKKFDGKTPIEKQRIREWLFWQWDKLALPVFRLRAKSRGLRQFGDEVRIMYEMEAKQGFSVIEAELAKSDWIALKRPTIADIGIYVVARAANEAHVDLGPYPRVQAWKKRFESLPGFGTPEQILPMESRLL